jgi:hypothetical protein
LTTLGLINVAIDQYQVNVELLKVPPAWLVKLSGWLNVETACWGCSSVAT